MKGIRKDLYDYVFGKVVPQYATFDSAHREDHALTVISQAMELYESAPADIKSGLDPEILLCAAAFHDTGMRAGREYHHLESGRIVRQCRDLRKWFDESGIEIIAQAAEDHRASSAEPPRSIYGKVIAEADRVIDTDTIIRRTLQYGMAHYPGLTEEEQMSRAASHLSVKYGEGGYLKLWIPWSGNAVKLKNLQLLLSDPDRLTEQLQKILQSLQGLR